MTSAAYQYYNPAYLESLIGDDADTKMIIFSTLLEEVPEELNVMQSLLAQQNWHKFHEVSHKLKSTLAYIGNEAISAQNNTMMLNARNNTGLNDIPALLEDVKHLWSLIRPEIEFALAELSN